jgi:predicted CopG family antitoxin
MAAKTVALDSEAYELLKRQKRSDESFSDTVKRLARPRRPITTFAGMWGDLTEKERKGLDWTYSGIRDADRRRTERIRQMWSGK